MRMARLQITVIKHTTRVPMPEPSKRAERGQRDKVTLAAGMLTYYCITSKYMLLWGSRNRQAKMNKEFYVYFQKNNLFINLFKFQVCFHF